MVIERTENEVVLRLPSDIDTYQLEKITRYLKYLESTKNSTGNEDMVNKIADESKKRWWSENKKRFID